MTPRPALQFPEDGGAYSRHRRNNPSTTKTPPSKLGPEDRGTDRTDTPDDVVVVGGRDYDGGNPPPSLDELIKTKFEECRKAVPAVLRTDPLESTVRRRRLPGPLGLGLVAKYQPGLLSNKRSASLPPRVSVDEPFDFDASKFNFNRVPESEVLLRIEVGEGGGQHPVLANVSPLMYGHSLLIPWPSKCIPQRLTPGAVDVAVELLLGRSSSGDFRIGFNSLGGFSSVNHLHLHVLYPGEVMAALPDDDSGGSERGGRCGCEGFPIEYAPVLRNVVSSPGGVGDGDGDDGCRVDLLDWMVPCFSFLAASSSSVSGSRQRASVEAMGDGVVRFLSTLRHGGIPHNVLFIPSGAGAVAGSSPPPSSGGPGPRIIVIPRKPQHEFDPEDAGYNAALGEICGYLVARSRTHYDGFDEDGVVRRMEDDVACDPGVLDSLEAGLKLAETGMIHGDGDGGP